MQDHEPSAVPDGYSRVDVGEGYSRAFGPVYIDRAGARLGFRVAAGHLNPVGRLHGGALATFADMQGIVVRAGMEEGASHSPTISLSVDYIAPAEVGEWIDASIRQVGSTGSMLFTQAVFSAGERVIARSTAIYRIYRKSGE